MSEPATANIPPQDGDAPLAEVGRDELSVFLYLAFTDEELLALLRGLGVSVPGFRLEKLSGVGKADTLADELRATAAARTPVIEQLRKIYEFPALDVVPLTPPVAEEIGALAVEDDATVRMLWRLLADPQVEVRRTAHPILQALARTYYGGKGEAGQPSPAQHREKEQEGGDEAAQALAEARKAQRQAEQAEEKAARKAESLAAQLKDARAELSTATHELAQARRAAEKAEAALAKTQEQLAQAKGRVGKADLERTKKELEKAREATSVLEARAAKLTAERDALAAELVVAKRAADAPALPLAPAAEDAAVEEAPTTWLRPRFTQEFYDSLEGWDTRLQRAAFKQAYLLSENHRHPSLRALPLEGLPGYFRVRVATDVRLIYRRDEKTEVDILSLIDREDLDRYVRQAKTR